MHTIFSVLIAVGVASWCFDIAQRIAALMRQETEPALLDYMRVAIFCGVVIVPAAAFYYVGHLYSFLAGWAFAGVIHGFSTGVLGGILMPYLATRLMDQESLAVYGLFLYGPVTAVMLSVGLYLGNPFAIGAAIAVATIWMEYAALVNK